MAVFQIDIEKMFNAYYWTNVYHTNAPDLATAVNTAHTFTDTEIDVHSSQVLFTKTRTKEVGTDFYNTEIFNLPGDLSPAPDYLPLWNVVRVDFTHFAHRPCRKYLRLPLNESGQTSGILNADLIQFLTLNYVDPLISGGQLAAPNGDGILTGAVMSAVGMHQLRRGSKRKTRPVI